MRCQNPACVLWFFDTTRNGTRRWCSMAVCGNRAKARRHYDRIKKPAAPDPAGPDSAAASQLGMSRTHSAYVQPSQ